MAFAMLLALVAGQPLVAGAVLPAFVSGGAPAPLGGALLNFFAFLTAAAALLSRSALSQVRPLRLPLGALGGLTLLGVVQLLPLPEGVMRQIASVNLKIYHETAEILRLWGRKWTPAPCISIAPGQTVAILLQLLGGIALLLASVSLMRTRARRRVFGGVVLAVAVLQVLFLGVRGKGLSAAETGLEPAAAATLLGIALSVAFGAIWAELLTNAERGLDSPDAAERFERRFSPIAIRIILWLALATGLILCRVPSAIFAALAVTLVLLGLALGRQRKDLARRAAGAMLSLLILGVMLGASEVPSPDTAALESSRRDAVWRTSISAWREFPIVGSGLGTFREAFRRVQPRELPGLIDRAHSGPLELLVTGGLIGMALGATAVVSLLVLLLRAWRSQKHREETAVALAAFGALLFWFLAGLAESTTNSLSALPLLATVIGSGWAASQARGSRLL